jgi:hypothetical protein
VKGEKGRRWRSVAFIGGAATGGNGGGPFGGRHIAARGWQARTGGAAPHG